MSIICEQSTVNVSDVGYGGFENGVPKCAIGPVQMNNLQDIKNGRPSSRKPEPDLNTLPEPVLE